MQTRTEDIELTLAQGELRLKVAPWGASLRGFWRTTPEGNVEIATGYTGAKGKVGGQGDVLIPFPGRVRGGKYVFDGETHQMDLSDKEGPNAIHGFLRAKVWDVVEQGLNSVRFETSLAPDAHPGYPFALRASIAYELDSDGMTCRFAVENIGERSAPVGVGFHPYFTVGSAQIDSDTLTLPFAAALEFENLVPTGRVLPVDGTSLDFRVPRQIGDIRFNTCYLQPQPDPDGITRIQLTAPDGERNVTVWMSQEFGYVVLYSGDPLPETHRRRSLAIEPMTCGSDAFNHPEWGLNPLSPGDVFTGAWGVSAG
jgi:aldose 1-epimerase